MPASFTYSIPHSTGFALLALSARPRRSPSLLPFLTFPHSNQVSQDIAITIDISQSDGQNCRAEVIEQQTTTVVQRRNPNGGLVRC